MSKYKKKFRSTSGEEFHADVYAVLVAFNVTCPARQHAIKKLLMPGQRGSKNEGQDLDEALWSVSRAVDMACARRRDNHGANGEPEPMAEAELEPEPEPMAEPEPTAEPEPEPTKPKMVTWRLCVRINPEDLEDYEFYFGWWWYPSGSIPEHWYPLESQSQPVETVKQLPEGQEP